MGGAVTSFIVEVDGSHSHVVGGDSGAPAAPAQSYGHLPVGPTTVDENVDQFGNIRVFDTEGTIVGYYDSDGIYHPLGGTAQPVVIEVEFSEGDAAVEPTLPAIAF